MYLFLALAGYFILAIVAILDKFIIAEKQVSPLLFTFYSTITILPILLLAPWGARFLGSGADWFIALVSGFAFAGGLWTMYLGFTEGEVSHLAPLIGGVTPFFILLFGQLFLREIISGRQLLAIALLIVGSLLFAIQRGARRAPWRGISWAIISGALFALSHIAAKYLYNQYGFWSGFLWSRGAMGIFGLALLFSAEARRSVAGWFSRRQLQPVQPAEAPKKFWSPKLLLIGSDKLLGVAGAVLIQYSTALGSVTIVNALNGIQYVILVLMVYLLTSFSPRLFKEDYARGELLQESMASMALVCGLALLIL